MGTRAVGSTQNPDDWDLVDHPDQDVITPPVAWLPKWKKLSRFLLIRAWARGEFSDLGTYLKKVKAMRIEDPPTAASRAADQNPPGGGANGTVV